MCYAMNYTCNTRVTHVNTSINTYLNKQSAQKCMHEQNMQTQQSLLHTTPEYSSHTRATHAHTLHTHTHTRHTCTHTCTHTPHMHTHIRTPHAHTRAHMHTHSHPTCTHTRAHTCTTECYHSLDSLWKNDPKGATL